MIEVKKFDPQERLSVTIDHLLDRPETTHGLRRALRAARREITLSGVHNEAKAHLPPDLRASRVQIGGGSNLLPGFLNIDITLPADLIFDVREGVPLPTESAEFIFMEHFLEHVDYPISVKRIIAECRRVLATGGQLVIGVPDARMIIQAYLRGDTTIRQRMMRDWYGKRDNKDHFNTYLDLVNYVFRDQDNSDQYTPHLWAFDYEKLASLCHEAGFRKVEPWPHDASIANPKREWGSVYSVAYK